MLGGTTVHFVTDGIESARAAATGRGRPGRGARGGAQLVQRYLAVGLVDEFELHVVPVLLCDGERLFDNVGQLAVEQVRAMRAQCHTHQVPRRRLTTGSVFSTIPWSAVTAANRGPRRG